MWKFLVKTWRLIDWRTKKNNNQKLKPGANQERVLASVFPPPQPATVTDTTGYAEGRFLNLNLI